MHWSYGLLDGDGASVISVKDEIMTEFNGRKYWAFTLKVTSPWWEDKLQAEYRFNFLEFGHQSSFKPVPFDNENSDNLNILHLLGKRVKGENAKLYTVRWDLSKGDRGQEICLFGFPTDDPMYKQAAVDAVEGWNDVFVKSHGFRPFWVNTNPSQKYNLDLRCPTITWVSDMRRLRYTPLGIGQINADVRNGKILWGGAVIFGGLFRKYAKHYSPSDLAGKNFDSRTIPWDNVFDSEMNFAMEPAFFTNEAEIADMRTEPQMRGLVHAMMMEAMPVDQLNLVFGMFENIATSNLTDAKGFLRKLITVDNIEELKFTGETESAFFIRQQATVEQKINDVIDSIKQYGSKEERLDAFLTEMPARDGVPINWVAILKSEASNAISDTQYEARKRIKDTKDQFGKMSFAEVALGGFSQLASNDKHNKTGILANISGDHTSQQGQQEIVDNMKAKIIKEKMTESVFDLDRTFEAMMPDFHAMTKEGLEKKEYSDRLAQMIKFTISHEFGHVLGIGHNFKENIVPKKGSVPEIYYSGGTASNGLKFLTGTDKPYMGLKGMADKYQSASSTVMGYPSGRVEAEIDYDDIHPGPQDYLSVMYLYKGQYPTYKKGDEDFVFFDLPSDGEIPKNAKLESDGNGGDERDRITTYFENCNDYHASLMLQGPYCHRFARGSNATELMDNMFKSYNQNWLKRIINFAEASESSPWNLQYWLWDRSFATFSKARHFYDYMTEKYADRIKLIAESKQPDKNLEEFYETCSAEDGHTVNSEVERIFEGSDPEFRELCRVNGDAVKKIAAVLKDKGPDYTTFDHDSAADQVASVRGGDELASRYARKGKFWGTWKQLGLLPAKYAALFTLTTSRPYIYWSGYWSSWRGWPRWLWPIARYSLPGTAYKHIYSTLYPKEFTAAVADTVRHNLTFKSKGDGTNSIKRSVLAMGYFLWRMKYNNEYHRGYTREYLETVQNQNRFRINGWVVLIIKGEQHKINKDRLVRFDASMWDWGTREFLPLGPAFILPKGKLMLSPTDPNSFIYPVSALKWYADKSAYAIGIRVTFAEDKYTSLWTGSSKIALKDQYQSVLRSCVHGSSIDGAEESGNGLKFFFRKNDEFAGKEEFEGFLVPKDIAGNPTRHDTFLESVGKQYAKYYASQRWGGADLSPKAETCLSAQDGVGLVVSSAVALQGWWMPELRHFGIK